MTTILNALTALHQSLENLEQAATEQKAHVSNGPQQDLFNGVNVNPAVVAQKLDVTIERVEELLREG